MLRISVFQFKGESLDAPLSCEFDERGGTIGRDSSNQLALPDPERHMSRVQAEVKYADGNYLLIDHGSNATSVNGHPIGKGNSSPLRDGDEVGIAFYSMRVEVLRAAPMFAAGAPAKPASMPAPALVPQAPIPTPAQAAPAQSSNDPLGLFAAPASSAPAPAPSAGLFDAVPPAAPQADPFANLSSLSSPAQPAAAPAASSSDDPFAVFAAPAAKVIAPAPAPQAASTAASDDPFAAFGARPKADPAPSPLGLDPLGDPLGIGGGPAESNSLDALFSLDSGKSTSHDPFAGSALADPLFGGSSSITSADDPLALLSGATPAALPTERNDAPIMREAFAPPKVVAPTDSQMTPPVEPAWDMTRSAKPRGGVVSWDSDSPQLSASAISPPGSKPLPKAKIVVEGLEKPAPAAVVPTAPAPPPAPVAAAAASPASAAGASMNASEQELLDALARGLGVAGLKPPGGLSPQFMEHVGKIVREAAHGTIELLLARAVTKREVRAELTMIVSKNNNPLKFSPDVNFALMQLIAPQGAGFMPPVEAMRDAYDDLRAHQIGFMAGMRGALAGVLARFKPEDLEGRLTDKSFLDSVMPGNRKAKLWDLYEQRFAEISREAEDNFHTFFGREFLKAYEEQLDRLHDDRD